MNCNGISCCCQISPISEGNWVVIYFYERQFDLNFLELIMALGGPWPFRPGQPAPTSSSNNSSVGRGPPPPPPSPKGARRVITIIFSLISPDIKNMVAIMMTLQQIIDERISFLKEQINPNNKPEVNKTFQLQIDAISRSIDGNTEKVEAIISQKKTLLKKSKDVHE
jgi:hypothetical protein